MKVALQRGGFPIVLIKSLVAHATAHQCGTVRFGSNPAEAALDPFCRSFDHRNLFVVDASFFPSSAAVNPALTIAAQALRSADHMLATDLGAVRTQS
jgi:choline dehydrogenase-like flavoprotein